MSTETNKAIVRRYLQQVVAEGHSDLVDEFMAEGIVLEGTDLEPGIAAVAQWVAMLNTVFPDRRLTIDDVVAEEDRVVVRTTMTGTHRGEMQGIPATGKSVTLPAITIFRLSNGRIVKGWFATDNLKMMQQLGVIPVPQVA